MARIYNHNQTVIVNVKQGMFVGVVKTDPETGTTQKIRTKKNGEKIKMTRVLIRGTHYYVKNTKIHI